MSNSRFDVIFTPIKSLLGLILGYIYPYTPVATPLVFCDFKMHQIHIRPGLRPIRTLGSSSHSYIDLVGQGGAAG